jgi:hypothetical protein
VGPVKDFEATATTNKWKWTDEHDHENGNEKEASWVGPATDETEKSWARSEEEFDEGEVLSVDDGIVDNEEALEGIESDWIFSKVGNHSLKLIKCITVCQDP